MVSASQIREKIVDFLSAEIHLDDFEDWIVQNTWNVHQSGSLAAEDLTFSVEEALSEYSRSVLEYHELTKALENLVGEENHSIDVATAPPTEPILSLWGRSPVLRAYVRP